MEFLAMALAWVLMIIVPVVGLILVVYWGLEKSSTALRGVFGLFGYILVALPLYYALITGLAAHYGGH